MKLKSLIFVLFCFSPFSFGAVVGAGHVNGSITNITSIKSGILISIEGEVPQNCTSGNSWMEIKQEDTAMISMALTAWALGKTATIYTDSTASGFCRINQFDPSEL
ncbi:MAG: hypothetical protein RPR97_01955 [Colwellia sp.]